MSTIFELIEAGTIPGRVVWSDPQCFAILDIRPVAPGHTLVIPRVPIDKWTDLPSDLLAHLTDVATTIARAQEVAFSVPRSVLVIAGFEVPHATCTLSPHRLKPPQTWGWAARQVTMTCRMLRYA